MDWVLTKIMNNIEKLDAQKNVMTYITNSIRNYCIDEYRKVCVRQRKEYEVKELNSSRTHTPQHSFEFLIQDICKNKEEEVILSRIVFDKESIQDIAKDTNVPVKKIKCLLDRIKTDLTT
jgi:DNA-directed RNA polymerase specialized sigma24 family protein